jgi:hypothetical protein
MSLFSLRLDPRIGEEESLDSQEDRAGTHVARFTENVNRTKQAIRAVILTNRAIRQTAIVD